MFVKFCPNIAYYADTLQQFSIVHCTEQDTYWIVYIHSE